jgi:capsular polysaccharide biosynthesis protein
MVDLTNTRAQARDIATTINREGTQRLTFAMASQNLATAASLLNTFPASFADGVDKVYHQLKDILSIIATHQAESSLECQAEVSTLSPSNTKASL